MLDQFRAQKLEWNRANNQIYDRVETSSGDSNGRTLFVQISNGGTVEDLTGATLSLAWNKKTEQGLESFEEVDAKKGQYRLFYPTGMLVNHGVLQASLVLVDVTGRIESKPFDIIIHKGTVDDEAIESDNKFTALTTALVKVSQVQAEFDGLYADKSQMIDTLHDDKKADMEVLEADYSKRANTLEATYAPRLTEVSAQLAQTDTELNNRIDNIIATPTTVSEQEIMDARQGKASLGANITEVKSKVQTLMEHRYVIKNIFTNGGFSQGTTGWGASNGFGTTWTVTDRATSTGNSGVYLIQSDVFDNLDDIYYLNFDILSYSSGYLSLLNIHVDKPIQFTSSGNKSHIFVPKSASFNLYQGGFVGAVDNFLAVNLTKTFGQGYEPTLSEMDTLLNRLGGWFENEKVIDLKTFSNMTNEKINSNTELATKPFKLSPNFVYGGIDESNGSDVYGNNYSLLSYNIRSDELLHLKQGSIITNQSNKNYNLDVFKYKTTNLSDYDSVDKNPSFDEYIIPDDGYYRLRIRRTDYSTDIDVRLIEEDIEFNLLNATNKDHLENGVELIFIGGGDENTTNAPVGDATLVKFPNGENMGIDFHTTASGAGVVKDIYYNNGVKHLDYIVMSHWHDDHVGGLKTMLDQGTLDIQGATVFLPDPEGLSYALQNGILPEDNRTRHVEPLMQYFSDNNCTVIYPGKEYETYEIADCQLSFFNTDHSIYEGVSTNYNDWSMGCYITCGNTNACFTGDYGIYAQQALTGKMLKANIYKVEHHGWANSAIHPEYFSNVHPEVLISIDGRVHEELIMEPTSHWQTWSEKYGVPNYRTYRNNPIKIQMTKDSWKFKHAVMPFIRDGKNW